MEEPKIIKGYPTLTTVLGMDNTKFMIIDLEEGEYIYNGHYIGHYIIEIDESITDINVELVVQTLNDLGKIVVTEDDYKTLYQISFRRYWGWRFNNAGPDQAFFEDKVGKSKETFLQVMDEYTKALYAHDNNHSNQL